MKSQTYASSADTQTDAAANPAGASRLQSLRPVRRVAELEVVRRHCVRTMKIVLFVLLSLATSLGCAGEPPSEWKATFREAAQGIWGACFGDDGRFYATRLIRLRCANSPHDGDAQSDVARLLTQAPDDPRDALQYYLKSPDPYDRAFVIQVIAELGDRRFIPTLEALTKDTATISLWNGLGYDSVGDGARFALDWFRRGGWVHTPDTPLPKWLAEARKSDAR